MKEFFALRVVRHCTGCPEKLWIPSSGNVPGHDGWLRETLSSRCPSQDSGVWTRRPLKVPYNTNHYMIVQSAITGN